MRASANAGTARGVPAFASPRESDGSWRDLSLRLHRSAGTESRAHKTSTRFPASAKRRRGSGRARRGDRSADRSGAIHLARYQRPARRAVRRPPARRLWGRKCDSPPRSPPRAATVRRLHCEFRKWPEWTGRGWQRRDFQRGPSCVQPGRIAVLNGAGLAAHDVNAIAVQPGVEMVSLEQMQYPAVLRLELLTERTGIEPHHRESGVLQQPVNLARRILAIVACIGFALRRRPQIRGEEPRMIPLQDS